MRVDATPLLERRRVFESQDPEEVRAFMHTKEFELDLSAREPGAFDFVASAAYLPNAYIGYIRYGAAVRVRVPAERKRDDYFIHLPVRGTSEVVNRAGSAVCARGRAVISSPSGHLMRSEHGSERVTVSLTKSAIIDSWRLCSATCRSGRWNSRRASISPAPRVGASAGRCAS